MALLATGSITFTEQFDEVYALLSSDIGQVSVDNAGMPKTPLSTLPLSTSMSVYKANALQTGWSFSKIDNNATSAINSSTGVLTVTGISADSAYVDITATKSGEPSLTKRYVMTKVYQGETGGTGPQGPMGNPKALGVNKDLSKITVAGFNDDGTFGAATGLVYIGSSICTLNSKQYTVSQNGYGYILGNASGLIQFARLRAESDGTSGSHRMAWKEFNTNVEIVADAVIGQFKVVGLNVVMAEMIPGRMTDQFINTNFMEILRNAPDSDDAELVVMAMAMGADRVLQTLVAIDAFIRNLWVSRLESEAYSTDANGFPDAGFHLDGVSGIAKIANLIAKNADIKGMFTSDGFKTLPKVTGATVPTATVPKTIYKYSEMCDLLSAGDEQQVLSGTIEGYAFTKANRRVNQRVLLQQTGPVTITVSAGQEHIMSRIVPSKLFGYNFFCEWHINYTGNVSGRLYLRTKPGQTAAQISSEWWYDADESDNTNYVNQSDMTLRSYHDSGSYSGSYALSSERPDATVFVYSNAIWGSQDATSNYHKVWTEQAFN
jgi:hypothetical protein